MAFARKKLPVFAGEGQLRFRGFLGQVAYEITGDPATLRLGPARLRGLFTTTVENAEEAFRAGEGELILEGGQTFRITVIGHTAGSDVSYFEMRI